MQLFHTALHTSTFPEKMTQKVKVMTKKQREVILSLWNKGVRNAGEIQRRTSIGLSTIYYNLKKLEKTGDTAQKPGAGRP